MKTEEKIYKKVIKELSKFINYLSSKYAIYPLEAEDIKQECYLKIFEIVKKKHAVFSEDELVKYAKKSVVNNLIDMIRKNIKDTQRQDSLFVEELLHIKNKEREILIEREIVFGRLIAELVKNLEEADKNLFLLYLSGHDQKEIGNILGISGSTVSRRLRKLKEIVAKDIGA